MHSEIQSIDTSLFSIHGYELSLLREDVLHPKVSGNKFRKLKYNVLEAKSQQKQTLLTFGGAYSNHIAATAAAGKLCGMSSIGIIRGDELEAKVNDNPTLSYAKSCGMKLHFINRSDYRNKNSSEFLKQLKIKFGDFYLLPEGGTNALAVKGCTEILSTKTQSYDLICTSVGTGGTVAGVATSASKAQNILGFSALKGTFQESVIATYAPTSKLKITDAYCFGGYAKIDSNLVRFMNDFKNKTEIQLDPIYTGKMMYGIFDQMKHEKIPKNSRILAIHTGGLQGIPGMNSLLKKKNLPLLQ